MKRIDHLISTHYHQDHVGGLAALAQRIPIAHFIDHGPNVESPEQVSGFRAAYDSILTKAKHTVAKPGDRIAVAGLDWRIVQSAGKSIATPLAGAGAANAATCATFERKPDSARPDDNSQSVGSVITFGRFRVLDLGDLLWNNEHDLVCPRNMVGTVDLYMVTHHGLASSGSPQLVHSVRPRVAVMQNGTRKGGAPLAFQILRASPGLEDVWTLHWSYAGGIEHNSAGAFIANVDSASAIASVLTGGTGPGRRQRGAFTGALHQDLGAGGRDVHGDEHAERVREDVFEAVMRGCGMRNGPGTPKHPEAVRAQAHPRITASVPHPDPHPRRPVLRRASRRQPVAAGLALG